QNAGGGAAFFGFGDEPHVWFIRDEACDPGAEQGVIVDREYPDVTGVAGHICLIRNHYIAAFPQPDTRPLGTPSARVAGLVIRVARFDCVGTPNRGLKRPRTRRLSRPVGDSRRARSGQRRDIPPTALG